MASEFPMERDLGSEMESESESESRLESDFEMGLDLASEPGSPQDRWPRFLRRLPRWY